MPNILSNPLALKPSLKLSSHVIFAFPDVNVLGPRILFCSTSTSSEEENISLEYFNAEKSVLKNAEPGLHIFNVKGNNDVEISLLVLASLPTSLTSQSNLAIALADLFVSRSITDLTILASLDFVSDQKGIHVSGPVLNRGFTSSTWPTIPSYTSLNSHFLSTLLTNVHFHPTVALTLIAYPSKRIRLHDDERVLEEMSKAIEEVKGLPVSINKVKEMKVTETWWEDEEGGINEMIYL